MALDTSREAYEQLLRSGTLNKVQRRVLDVLRSRPSGLTRNELDTIGDPGRPNAPLSRRLAELERMGLIVRVGQRGDSGTGRVCDVWQYSGRAEPVEVPCVAGKPTPGTIEKAVRDLRVLLARAVGQDQWHVLVEHHPEVVRVCQWLAAGAPASSRAKQKKDDDHDDHPRSPDDPTTAAPSRPHREHAATLQASPRAGGSGEPADGGGAPPAPPGVSA